MSRIVSVRVLDAPFHIDKPFDYLLPPHVEDCPRGTLVRIPFGRGDRPTWGVVMGEGAEPDSTLTIKPVLSRLQAPYCLDEEMLGLCLFLSDYYLCTLGDAVRCVLPPALLSHKGLNIRYTEFLSLSSEGEKTAESGEGLRSPAHRQILAYLAAHPGSDKRQVCEELGVTPAQIKALLDKGLLTVEPREEIRNPYAKYAKRDTTPIHLSRPQGEALERLYGLYRENAPRAALLHGVTGSGKTKVMLSLIDRVIEDGRGVILMVPEIALTPQTVHIFCARYGERVAVIHSSLSAGERFDAWRRIRSGGVDLVIGTRSAVFAPMPNLGLMIVDEEHEHTYKSEQDPKYHVRQVCAKRAADQNSLVLFASATPAFESYHKAERGQYALIELKERFGGASLPKTHVVDMRQELRGGNLSPLSHALFSALEGVEEREEQAILFLNRRGYNASLQCRVCGEAVPCPRCSVALTYHTSPYPQLLCHLCGFHSSVPTECPGCGGKPLSYLGWGTQRVEGELGKVLPGMRLIRMDADTTGQKEAYDRLLEDFREGKADVLLGTQMVTKGHDFPRVTLVGVMLADTGLHVNDFRASERTFSLLTQVIGRAGRADREGEAIIQTFSPQNDVIRMAMEQDYRAFYESEIQLRKEMNFPPFCDMVQLTLSAESEEVLSRGAKALADKAVALAGTEYSHLPLEIFGPMEAGVYKVAGEYRMRLIFKCHWDARTRDLFKRLLKEGASDRRVTLSIDINPLHA